MKRLKPFVCLHIHVVVIFFICCLLLLNTSIVDAKIVFCIENDIYVMNDDGSSRRQLTKNTVSRDKDPHWSPDGKTIAFGRRLGRSQSTYELFTMNANGTNVQRLTDNTVIDGGPSWSPDGKSIAFTSTRSGKWEVHVIDLATLDVTQLTDVNEDGGRGSVDPDWSPDGTEIAYQKFEDIGFRHIYVMSANGDNKRPLLPVPKREADITDKWTPRWSADGKRIVFDDCVWENEHDKCRLTIMTLHGKTQRITHIYDQLRSNLGVPLGNLRVLVGDVRWMNNDRELLFDLEMLNAPNPNYDLYIYNLNARSLKRLTRGEKDEDYPDWTEGTLSVSPQDKKEATWGEVKKKENK